MHIENREEYHDPTHRAAKQSVPVAILHSNNHSVGRSNGQAGVSMWSALRIA
jgi:hypothetical protein